MILPDPNQPNGDADLYRKWKRPLTAFFRRRVADASEAEDLAHDTILRVLSRGGASGSLSDGYIFRVAQNILIDRQRKLYVRNQYARADSEVAPDSFAIDPERTLQGREDVATLVALLERFPERTRSMFLLYRLENMSQSEIGEAFGISASAVKQQIAKVMAMLARKLREQS